MDRVYVRQKAEQVHATRLEGVPWLPRPCAAAALPRPTCLGAAMKQLEKPSSTLSPLEQGCRLLLQLAGSLFAIECYQEQTMNATLLHAHN